MLRARHASSSESARLRLRLAEAEETLRAIRSGEVDTVMVAGKTGPQVFTLEGAGDAYRVLIESMNEGALTLTADKTILYANQCFARMVKCPLEQVTGGSFRRFLSDENRATLRAVLEPAAKYGSKIQVLLNAADGSQLPAQISIRPLVGNDFNGATVSMVVTDMTESRRVALQEETERLYGQVREQAFELERRVVERTKQLLHANQELEAFEASVSHDLKSPLRHIRGFAELLLDVYAGQFPEEARTYLQQISDSAKKMNGLITALLAFSRAGKKSLAREPVDVGRMWREVFEEMKPELGGRVVEVRIGEIPFGFADPTLLRQVLVNLLANAIKYSRTRDPAVIEISACASPEGEGTIHVIKDNGVGFDMAKADKLFVVFERLHRASEFEGTGVGLATVQRIIQRHGGRVWSESEPGAGAAFFFTVGGAVEVDG